MPLLYFEEFCKETKLPSATCSIIADSYRFTAEKISLTKKLLQKELKAITSKDKYCVVAVGSYGRYEASQESDLDGYIIYEKNLPTRVLTTIDSKIKKVAREGSIRLSEGFKHISLNDMHKNIGGEDDTNPYITNRILFLLESECLYGLPFYSLAYKNILKKYLNDVLKFKKQSPRFLLSDIIRYYRTICVDYEFKVTEENKDWALRNIKLRFSRKGLYFGGIAILLNSMNKRDTDKYAYIYKNLRLPFADKISHILLEQHKTHEHANILSLYADFLKEISAKRTRDHLKKLHKSDRRKDEKFLSLEKKANSFNVSLRKLLDNGTWGDKNYIDLLVL
ncbi:MAG: hypothetical protein FD156_384 [Nitrospirae bacterium]|nr:MAG: hypothetical protein FD156_384 [Nitrospirota bacterium]